MKAVAVIPARYSSTRFPGKPLAIIAGKPMVQWVYENAMGCDVIEEVVVATDNYEIEDVVKGFGGKVCITAEDHKSGTDRIAEAAEKIDADIIVNLQCDEPLLPPDAIRAAVEPLQNDTSVNMSTLKTKINNPEDISNPNIVKVITDVNGNAVYFSRFGIPYVRDHQIQVDFFKHIGLYVYRRDFLYSFTRMPLSQLETAESLEQLRAIENGFTIKVVETSYNPVGVDVPEDVEVVEKLIMGIDQ